MTIQDRFLTQLAHTERSGTAPPELRPSRLASTCYEVLPIAAAAISVFTADGLRFPVGASTPRAAYAERLQFTTGEGPCLDLRVYGQRILADDDVVSRCWPRFHDWLLRETPYRAVAALPVTDGDETWATVDLFFAADADLHRLHVPDAVAVVDLVGALMLENIGGRLPTSGNPVSAARQVTMTAMGLLNSAHDLTAEEALDALRAHATAAGITVDALADALVNGRRPWDHVVPSRTGGRDRSVAAPR